MDVPTEGHDYRITHVGCHGPCGICLGRSTDDNPCSNPFWYRSSDASIPFLCQVRAMPWVRHNGTLLVEACRAIDVPALQRCAFAEVEFRNGLVVIPQRPDFIRLRKGQV